MRIIIFLLLISTIISPAFSQKPAKKAVSAKNEMQSEMNKMVDTLKKQFADLQKELKTTTDPEEKKSLEEQISMLQKQLSLIQGVNKSLWGMSDKVIQQAMEEESVIIPKKDVTRINMLPKKILTDAELAGLVKTVHSEVGRLLDEKIKTEANKIYTTAKAEKRSSNYINNIANSLWLSGNTELAIYLLGKACTADMSNANNLNNYAAFLSMAGGEHAALPILQNLNKRFPDNSTILNNIAQSWYGLGDLNNAKKYFDNTMRVYSLHSQANQTMCMIQQSEGKTVEAVESIKRSIKENYTTEKEVKLNELGGKLEYDDIPFRYPVKAEPLGIEKFMTMIPSYPFESGVPAEIRRREWDDFRRKVYVAQEKVIAEKRIIELKVKNYSDRLQANSGLLKPYNTAVYKTSARKLVLLNEWYQDRFIALSKKIYAAGDSVAKWRDEAKALVKALGDEPTCGSLKSIATNFMSKSNTLWQQRNAELMSLEKQNLNAVARLSLYGTHDPSLYELAIVNIKEGFLIFLRGLPCEFDVVICDEKDPGNPPGKVLPDFDSLTCQYTEEYFIPPFTKIKIECNRMTTEFDIDTELGIKIKAGWEENLNSGKITKGNLEIAKEFGPEDPTTFGKVIGAELKGELRAGVEITGDGVQEVYIKGSSTIDLAGNIGDSEITPGVQSGSKGLSAMSAEVKVSWNVGSGPNNGTMNSSLSGQGMLTPINISLK